MESENPLSSNERITEMSGFQENPKKKIGALWQRCRKDVEISAKNEREVKQKLKRRKSI